MSYIIGITLAINSLAFTIPILIRGSLLFGDWADAMLEDFERKKQEASK